MRVGNGVGQAMPTWVAAYVHDTTGQVGYLSLQLHRKCPCFADRLQYDNWHHRVGVRVCMCDECGRSCCVLCVLITSCACVYGLWAHSVYSFRMAQGRGGGGGVYGEGWGKPGPRVSCKSPDAVSPGSLIPEPETSLACPCRLIGE